ncbi:UNVERIFIED_CONTAM: hypothetical protein Sradi_3197600 [Sesamum radiatum]|uniref:Uncharacterized protein n=1 Tax=Sesamum radiatum TaxID=300843 RepID=A0AAW2RFV3_SESRA
MKTEALAMAGVNCMEIGISLENLELGFFYDPPSYLTVAEENIDQNMSCRVTCDDADHDSVRQIEEKIKRKDKGMGKGSCFIEAHKLVAIYREIAIFVL